MESSHGGSNSLAPFLTKTYEMLDDPSTNSIVSWGPSGGSFIVWNQQDFARDLLPTYFKHNNFSSFIRQLNTYGFRKIDPERWEFANDEFIRGQKHLLKNIHRRKPIHSHSTPPHGSNTSMPLSESERQDLKEEIERLNHDKSILIIELQNHTEYMQCLEQQMQDLEDQLQALVLQQRSLISFLDQVIQRPGFLSGLFQPSDLHTKKRRLPKHDCLLVDTTKQDEKHLSLLDTEPFEKMEASLNSLETFFLEVGLASGDDALFEEHLTSAGDIIHTSLEGPTPGCPEDLYADLVESPSHSENTAISLLDFHSIETSTTRKASFLDMNSKTVIYLRDRETEAQADTSLPITEANDIFWQQFLTENPGCCDSQETQFERSDVNDKRTGEVMMIEKGRAWWSRKSVNNLTERMGQLTSAERT